jgi:hypothetical protein
MGSVFHFIDYNVKRMFASPKPYLTFLVIFAVLRIGLGSANTYLEEQGQNFQAVECFVFTHSAVFFQIVYVFGLLFLLGDAPFLEEGMSVRLIRTSRSKWLMGQILSCVVISAMYLLALALLLVLLFWNHITFQNAWSDPIRLAAQVGMGETVLKMKAAVYFPMDVLQAASPYAMFGLTFVYDVLLYSFLCLVVIVCNLKCSSGIGTFAAASILGIKLVQKYVLPYKPLWYLSPCSIVCFGDQPITGKGIAYTVLFLTLLCLLLSLLSFRFARNSDLLKGDHA